MKLIKDLNINFHKQMKTIGVHRNELNIASKRVAEMELRQAASNSKFPKVQWVLESQWERINRHLGDVDK